MLTQRLRARGLPDTPMYREAEEANRNRRNLLARARNARRNARMLDVAGQPGAEAHREAARLFEEEAGPARRPEPDQVVAARERGDDGRLQSGAEAGGAIATGLTEKVELDKPTLADSTWQLDLMDMSTKQDTAGYGMLAVDVASRYLYGILLQDKTYEGVVEGFGRLLQLRGAFGDKRGNQLGAPALIDTDREAAWNNADWKAEMQRRGIQHRMRTDAFSPNNLGMIDEKIKRVKEFIRRRMTESGGNWTDYFDAAVAASNGRKHKQALYGMAPEEVYDEFGEPASENAEHTIFAISTDMATKFAKNKNKEARKVEKLKQQGGFRAPLRMTWERRSLQATHGGRTIQVSGFEGSRVLSPGRTPYPVSTVQAVPFDSRDVRIPERLQRPGRQSEADKRRILAPFRDLGVAYLRAQPLEESAKEAFELALRPSGFPAALQEANIRGAVVRKFARLFPEFGMTDHERKIYLIPDASEEEDEDGPPRRVRIDRHRQLMRDYAEVAAFPEFQEV